MTLQMALFSDERIKVEGDGVFLVESASSPGTYRRVVDGMCDCPGYAARRRCRHITMLIEDGKLEEPKEPEMMKPFEVVSIDKASEYGVVTSRYSNKTITNDLVVPVQTSLGGPKFPTGFSIVESMPSITPDRWMLKASAAEYLAGYRAKLDRIGVEAIIEEIEEIRARHDDKPVAILCFENVHKGPHEWCHRRIFSDFIFEQTDATIPELAG